MFQFYLARGVANDVHLVNVFMSSCLIYFSLYLFINAQLEPHLNIFFIRLKHILIDTVQQLL